jgi:ParB family chromosome partitioning protein
VATTKKSGLGRGLGALIGGGAAFEPVTEETAAPVVEPTPPPAASGPQPLEDGSVLLLIDPRAVRPNPKQPRHFFNEDALRELAESIKRDGVQEPVIVRKKDGLFELVSGERRVRASVIAGVDRIPAVCREVSDEDMLKLGLIENIQREDLNPIETARAYRALALHFGWTQEQLAEQVGKKRATVTNILRLLNLPEEVQQMVIDGSLSMGHARALLALELPTRQVALARRAIEEGLSVRDVERAVAPSPPPAPAPEAKLATRKDPHIAQVEDELRRRLGTKVRVASDASWKGTIEIDFFNLDELERILAILRGE